MGPKPGHGARIKLHLKKRFAQNGASYPKLLPFCQTLLSGEAAFRIVESQGITYETGDLSFGITGLDSTLELKQLRPVVSRMSSRSKGDLSQHILDAPS